MLRRTRRSLQPARAPAATIGRVIPRLGLIVGAIGGALYGAQSTRHMIVPGPYDKLIVGILLTCLAAIVGWLAGLMLVSSVDPADAAPAPPRRDAGHTAGSQADADGVESGPRQSQT